jgi:hypothetical protein
MVVRARAPGGAVGSDLAGFTARGVVGAMAMSGLRRLTRALGLVTETPPESVLGRTAPRVFNRLPVRRRPVLVELAHWAYGAAGGAAYGALPASWRERAWAGPAYGLVVWTLFEGGIAPVLGISRRPSHTRVEAAALLVDHLLYGAVEAGRPQSRVRNGESGGESAAAW